MLKTSTRRANVTVDDRRAVLMLAKARKPRDVAAVPHEAFIRNTLKDRLGWARTTPAPQSILDAAKQMAQAIVVADKAKWAAEDAKKAAAEAAKPAEVAA